MALKAVASLAGPLYIRTFINTYIRACVRVHTHTHTHTHTPFVRSSVHLFIPLIRKFAKIRAEYGVSDKHTNCAKQTKLLQYSYYRGVDKSLARPD